MEIVKRYLSAAQCLRALDEGRNNSILQKLINIAVALSYENILNIAVTREVSYNY